MQTLQDKKYRVANVNEHCLENNVVILMHVIRFSKDIPVNSLPFQNNTFGFGKNCCILRRNGVHGKQFGMLYEDTVGTHLFIYLFTDSISFANQLQVFAHHIPIFKTTTKIKLYYIHC